MCVILQDIAEIFEQFVKQLYTFNIFSQNSHKNNDKMAFPLNIKTQI